MQSRLNAYKGRLWPRTPNLLRPLNDTVINSKIHLKIIKDPHNRELWVKMFSQIYKINTGHRLRRPC